MPFCLKKIGKNFIFHSNLNINPNKIKEWEEHFLSLPSLPSSVSSQCSWDNKYIKIDDKTIFNSSLSAKGMTFVDQLFQNDQQIKKWDELKTEFDLIENGKFVIAQITNALPSSWKEIL